MACRVWSRSPLHLPIVLCWCWCCRVRAVSRVRAGGGFIMKIRWLSTPCAGAPHVRGSIKTPALDCDVVRPARCPSCDDASLDESVRP
eukprot:scaffold932_cov60-Phaeocystis_antarctica.AAC.2